jgi:hypothetical protein
VNLLAFANGESTLTNTGLDRLFPSFDFDLLLLCMIVAVDAKRSVKRGKNVLIACLHANDPF